MEATSLNELNITPNQPFTLRRASGDIDLLIGGRVQRGDCVGTTTPAPSLADVDGRLDAGALAVLVDEVLGFAMVDAEPDRRWSASSDISLELFAPLAAGQELTARGHTLWVGGDQSYAECTVTDSTGAVVGHATQRGRYNDEPAVEEDESVTTPADNALELFGISEVVPGPTLGEVPGGIMANGEAAAAAGDTGLPSATVALSVGGAAQNPQGNLHGGVSIIASLLAAKRALALRGNAGLAATSIRIAYARAATAGQRVEYTASMLYGGRSLSVLQVVGMADGKPRTIAQVTAHPFSG